MTKAEFMKQYNITAEVFEERMQYKQENEYGNDDIEFNLGEDEEGFERVLPVEYDSVNDTVRVYDER